MAAPIDFSGCFDESGGEDIGFTLVSGYAASTAQWESFEVDWKLFLIKFGVPYLHMKEYSQSTKCYKQWKGNERLRAAFTGMAAEIINSHLKRTFISIVSHEDFEKADAIYKLRERFKSPYALAGRSCIGLANNWARNPSTRALNIEYIFEDGGPDKSGLISATQALPPFLPAPTFKPSRDMAPSTKWPKGRVGLVQLQAADYIAYEARKFVVDHDLIKRGERAARKSLGALTKVPLDMSSWGEQRLLKVCEAANFEKR